MNADDGKEISPNNPLSFEILTREPYMDEGPIEIIGNEETKQWFAVIGKHRLTEIHTSKEDLLNFMMTQQFQLELIMILAQIVCDKYIQSNKNLNQWLSSKVSAETDSAPETK